MDGYRAVLFDLGGVVLPSPFEAWAEYERELGLPVGFIRGVVASGGDHGAWARHERGELSLEEFCAAFEAECAAAGGTVSAAEALARIGTRPEPRAEMLVAIGRIRAHGYRTGALTNNWRTDASTGGIDALAPLFDAVVESSATGLRKPDPRIYLLACRRLEVEPPEVVFLDDLGVNLKPARELGMATIKVVDPRAALRELGAVLGVPLA